MHVSVQEHMPKFSLSSTSRHCLLLQLRNASVTFSGLGRKRAVGHQWGIASFHLAGQLAGVSGVCMNLTGGIVFKHTCWENNPMEIMSLKGFPIKHIIPVVSIHSWASKQSNLRALAQLFGAGCLLTGEGGIYHLFTIHESPPHVSGGQVKNLRCLLVFPNKIDGLCGGHFRGALPSSHAHAIQKFGKVLNVSSEMLAGQSTKYAASVACHLCCAYVLVLLGSITRSSLSKLFWGTQWSGYMHMLTYRFQSHCKRSHCKLVPQLLVTTRAKEQLRAHGSPRCGSESVEQICTRTRSPSFVALCCEIVGRASDGDGIWRPPDWHYMILHVFLTELNMCSTSMICVYIF